MDDPEDESMSLEEMDRLQEELMKNFSNYASQKIVEAAHGLDDTGRREASPTGALKEPPGGRGQPELMSIHALFRYAIHAERGAIKYAARNWEKGAFFSRIYGAAQRHLMRWARGDRGEDHLAAAFFWIAALMHYEEEIKAGRLPATLDDMPHYTNGGTHEYGQSGDGAVPPLSGAADRQTNEGKGTDGGGHCSPSECCQQETASGEDTRGWPPA